MDYEFWCPHCHEKVLTSVKGFSTCYSCGRPMEKIKSDDKKLNKGE